MKFVQQLVCSYLAVCFVIAGAVGVSPALHQLVEHGGHGPVHAHVVRGGHGGGGAHSHPHSHPHGENDGHFHGHVVVASSSATAPRFAHDFEPFGLPKISLDRLWNVLGRLFDPVATGSDGRSPREDETNHEHHSLPQMLVNGTVEQPAGVLLIVVIPFPHADRVWPPASTSLPNNRWDALTASRGPPDMAS